MSRARYSKIRVWIRPDGRVKSKTCDESCPLNPAKCSRASFDSSATTDPVTFALSTFKHHGDTQATNETAVTILEQMRRSVTHIPGQLAELQLQVLSAFWSGAVDIENMNLVCDGKADESECNSAVFNGVKWLVSLITHGSSRAVPCCAVLCSYCSFRMSCLCHEKIGLRH